MNNIINYDEIESFGKEFKKLKKRFPTLDEDLKIAKKSAIELFHLHNINNQSIFLIPGFADKNYEIYKLKKFACKSLKGKGIKSGIRIIYAYCLEKNSVDFLEIYFKADKSDEDKIRIMKFLENNKKNNVFRNQLNIETAKEKWLWKNKVVLNQIKQGLQDSAAGRIKSREDFSNFVDDDK